MKRFTIKDNVISALIGLLIGTIVIVFGVIPARGNAERPTVSPEILRQEYDRQFDIDVEQINFKEKKEENAIIISNLEDIEKSDDKTNDEPYFNYTEKDIYLVGNTVFHEIGIFFQTLSEEKAEKAAYYTASCIVNRAKMNYMELGNTIEAQIAPSQYASADKVTAQKEDYVSEKIYQIAEDVMQNGPATSETLVFQSEFPQGEVVEQIGNQYFGVLPN